ncbi:flagellin [Priestia megaterium]|uniref:flagellin N-terminal helical domain-containing protein n=1 Tax=Priestia megaterium TaxID=1404 RepID=UPI00300938A0
MRINHNITALNTYRQYNTANNAQAKSMEKLSSGQRINNAADDAAGLAISEKMRGQIRGLDQATRNAQDGVSLIQTAEGALSETTDILQRMRELSVQASNDTATDDDRKALQDEVKQLKSEVDRIGNNTEFNTKKLINGALSGSQVGGMGGKIGTSTSASIDTGWIDVTNGETGGTTTKYQLTIDDKTLDFDIAGSANDTLGQMEEFKTAIESAITTYNTGADEKDKIAVPQIALDVQKNGGNNEVKLSITSSTTGSGSKLQIKALDDAGSTGQLAAGDTKTKLLKSSAGSDGKLNSDDALDALTSSDKLSLSINGQNIDVDLTDVLAGNYSDGNEMTDIADDLQSDINDALTNYKNLTGTDFGSVSVSVKDGALKIESSKADTVNIEIGKNKAADALGLSGTGTSVTGGLDFQIGANQGQSINLQINDMTASGLNIADVDISTRDGASNSIKSLDEAIKSVSTQRANLGAIQNRLDHTINNLTTSSENTTAAESRIRDVDYALTA